MTYWSFSATTSVIVLAALVLLASLVFSIRQWRRTAIRGRMLGLEVFRLLIIVLIVFTLLRPEWVEKTRRLKEAEVVVLCDASGSMKTRDVLSGDNAMERRQWLDRRMQTKFWAPLETDYKVSIESFSATPTRDEDASAAEDGTDLNAALAGCAGKHQNLRAVILLSDGDWNMGRSPVEAAAHLRELQVPVFTVPIGSESYLPDIELADARVPSFCLRGEKVSIPFRIRSHLPRDVRTRINLLIGGQPEAHKDILIPAQSDYQDTIIWDARNDGTYTMTLTVPVQQDEKIRDNNEMSFTIAVRTEVLKVLVVDTKPRWEYRYLRNALSRDPGVEVHCLLLHPNMKVGGGTDYISAFPDSREKISQYDVIFLGDIGIGKGELTVPQTRLIKGLVEQQGSGLVFLPGFDGKQMSLLSTPLGELMPVELQVNKPSGFGQSVPSKLVLTSYGRDHLLTLLADTPAGNPSVWRQLPGFYWYAPVLKARPGSRVLAVHGAARNDWGRLPLLVTREAGSGNVLFMGTDAAWRWRRGVEDLYHYRFWGQVVRWMAHKRHMAYSKGLRLFFTPENPRVGDTVFLQVTAFDSFGYPIEDARVFVDVLHGDEKAEQIELSTVEGGWGVYEGSFKPADSGPYRLIVDCRKISRQLEAKLTVGRRTREKIGQPARKNTLREIARITRGEMAEPAQLDALVQQIDALPRQVHTERRVRLWSQWWWGGLIVLLLGLYWTGRKFVGLV